MSTLNCGAALLDRIPMLLALTKALFVVFIDDGWPEIRVVEFKQHIATCGKVLRMQSCFFVRGSELLEMI